MWETEPPPVRTTAEKDERLRTAAGGSARDRRAGQAEMERDL